MKKKYIIKLGLTFLLMFFFNSNTYASTKFIYLSCKAIVKKNLSQAEVFQQDHMSIESHVGQLFYKFKDKGKNTKIKIYEQGKMTEKKWTQSIPELNVDEKFRYDSNNKKYSKKVSVIEDLYLFYSIENTGNNSYFHTYILKWGKQNELHLEMESPCEIVDKKKFKKLIKNGVK
ncbi:hypothetical protein OA064_00440 [Candidatus Pelagibacter sp.]|nr:hypothetical protein [Candidatus Pelagibacter sp.]